MEKIFQDVENENLLTRVRNNFQNMNAAVAGHNDSINDESTSLTLNDNTLPTISAVQSNRNRQIDETFANTDSPERQLQCIVNAMGVFEKILFRNAQGKLLRKEAEEIAKMLLNYQTQTTLHKLTLAFALEKQRTFLAYIYSSNSLQKELFIMDSKARAELSHTLLTIDTAVWQARRENHLRIQRMQQKNILSENEALEEECKNNTLTRKLLDDSLKTLDHLWRNHAALLNQTLMLFTEKLRIEEKI